jgi:hypothetical protein
VGDPENFSTSAYDVSETAFKRLYSDIDDIRSDELMMKIIKEADEQAEPNPRTTVDRAAKAAPRPAGEILPPKPIASKGLAPSASTPSIDPALVKQASAGAPKAARRRRPIQMIVLAAVALAAIGFLYERSQPDHIIRPWLTIALQTPAPHVTGLLHVADLAAGRTIKPGETYGVDIPPDTVRIAVISGQVKLANGGADLLRPCSSETFTVEVKEGRRVTKEPYISSCNDTPAFIQAVIPQPTLPDDAAAPTR